MREIMYMRMMTSEGWDMAMTTMVTLTSLSSIVVGLRLYTRYYLVRVVEVHDYLMAGAVLATWIISVLNYFQISFGHSDVVHNPKADRKLIQKTFGDTLLLWYIYRMMYPITLLLIKLSILFFYRHIAVKPSFSRAINLTMIFLSIYTFIIVAVSGISCTHPADAFSVRVFFSYVIGKPLGSCINPTSLWFAQAGFNVVTDTIILILPIPSLSTLRIPNTKKVALVAIFSLAMMAIIASCIRLAIVTIWSSTIGSQEMYFVAMLIWGQVEINSGILSASLPFLRPLVKHIFGGKEDKEPLPGVE